MICTRCEKQEATHDVLCRACDVLRRNRERIQQRRQRRREFLAEMHGGKCLDCGSASNLHYVSEGAQFNHRGMDASEREFLEYAKTVKPYCRRCRGTAVLRSVRQANDLYNSIFRPV